MKKNEKNLVLDWSKVTISFPEILKGVIDREIDKINDSYFTEYLPEWDSNNRGYRPKDLEVYIAQKLKYMYRGTVKVKRKETIK